MTIFMPAISGQLEICGSIDWNYLLGELFMTLNFRKQYVSCVKSFLSRFLFCRLILKLFVGKIHSSANIYQEAYIYSKRYMYSDVLSKYPYCLIWYTRF